MVRALYKERFRAAIKNAFESGQLQMPPDHSKLTIVRLLRVTSKKTWCVKIEEQYAHGKGVLLYLSRYLRGGPIHPKQIMRCDAERIGFRYKGHRSKRQKLLLLKPSEFIRRVLLHVPEPGQHVVRHYGLYSSASRTSRNNCRLQLGGLVDSTESPDEVTDKAQISCKLCGEALVLKRRYYAHRRKGNSYKAEYVEKHVQQTDEPDQTQIKKRSMQLRL